MTIKRITLLLTAVLAAVGAVWGAEPQFTVIPPRRAVEGERFVVTYRLDNADGSGLQVSNINGCTLIYGPSTSSSQSYSIVNGRMDSSTRMEYTYTYRADKAGEYTIPAATVVANGKRLSTKPVKFTVMAGSAAQQPGSQRPTTAYDPDTQTSERPVNASDVFVRINLSKSTAYEQEAVECTMKLYTTYSISEFFVTKQPEFEGCLIQEVDNQAALNSEETLNGRTYLTAVLKKCIIFPQRPGRLTINSGTYDLVVVQYDNVNMGGFMTVRQPRERRIKIQSNSAALQVKALPEPRPAGFTGAVGKFTAKSRLVGNSFRTNEPGSLVYTITGTGNIKYLKEPEIDFPSEFELYTPQSQIDARVAGSNVTGTMTVDYTFVPQTTGQFRIGSDTFVYFDPAEGRYVTEHTEAYDIKVARGAATALSADQEEIQAKNTDIDHIVLGPKSVSGPRTPMVWSWWYWTVYIVLAGALVASLLIWRRRLALAADTVGLARSRAAKKARRRLEAARRALAEGHKDAFHAETLATLNGYLSDKYAIPAGRLSRPVIDETLAGVDPAVKAELDQVLDTCEMASYSPASADDMQLTLERAEAVINSLERTKP